MNGVLQSLVDRGGGIVTRTLAGQVVPESTLRAACHAGRLLRLLPQVYVDARLVPPGPDADLPLLARLSPELARRAVLATWTGGVR